MPTLELILAEFGPGRGNAGDARLPVHRLEPTLSSFLKWFPGATAVCYTDQDWQSDARCRVAKVDPPLDRSHPRYGWRANDYYKARGVLDSQADVALGLDSDLLIVEPRATSLVPLALRFGLCMPVNGRHILWLDARSTCDGGPVEDDSAGMGMCHCTALWAFHTRGPACYRELLERYCRRVIEDAQADRSSRGPLSLWRAEWDAGVSPYTLPINWCITAVNLEVEEPVILHVGHEKVAKKYKKLIARMT